MIDHTLDCSIQATENQMRVTCTDLLALGYALISDPDVANMIEQADCCPFRMSNDIDTARTCITTARNDAKRERSIDLHRILRMYDSELTEQYMPLEFEPRTSIGFLENASSISKAMLKRLMKIQRVIPVERKELIIASFRDFCHKAEHTCKVFGETDSR